MEWLLTHMWMALAGVALFGVLLGWAVRGIMVMGKFHRAIGEKEIANAELLEARNELDVLLKAQRGEIPVQPHPVAAGGADEVLKKELKDREKRLADLAGELAKSKQELDTLKSSKSRGGAAAAVVGAVAGAGVAAAAGKDDGDDASLAWRNRHLEARLKELEAQIESISVAETEAPRAASVGDMNAPSDEDKVLADKAAWKIDYLNQRIAALEDEAINMRQAAVSPEAVVAAPILETVASGANEDVASSEDEELARLRWRNRYLEGRLAYFEADASDARADEAAPEETEQSEGLAAAAVIASAAAATAILADEDDEATSESDPGDTSVEAVMEAVEAISDEVETQVEETAPETDAQTGAVSDAILKSLTEADEAADAEDAEAAQADSFEFSGVSEDTTEADPTAIEDQAGVDETEVEVLPEAASATEFLKPLALDGPVGGQPDDLTVIGGVGPKIQEVLNGLGVYHYDQIAAWTPENVAWIDDHLSFAGRIDREGWVEQAIILAGDD